MGRERVSLQVSVEARGVVKALAVREGFAEADAWRRVLKAGLVALGLAAEGPPLSAPSASVAPVTSSASRIGLPSRPTVEELRARVASVPASPARRPVERALPEGWVRDARGVAQWMGALDAEGNPLVEDPA